MFNMSFLNNVSLREFNMLEYKEETINFIMTSLHADSSIRNVSKLNMKLLPDPIIEDNLHVKIIVFNQEIFYDIIMDNNSIELTSDLIIFKITKNVGDITNEI